MSEYVRGWNAAIKAAADGVHTAPIFPKKDHGGPIADAERISILENCRKQIETLRRSEPA